jgi:hypothetical protein
VEDWFLDMQGARLVDLWGRDHGIENYSIDNKDPNLSKKSEGGHVWLEEPPRAWKDVIRGLVRRLLVIQLGFEPVKIVKLAVDRFAVTAELSFENAWQTI